jgi:hypothetical protein
VEVAQQLRRGVEQRDDRHAQAVAARHAKGSDQMIAVDGHLRENRRRTCIRGRC